MKGNAVYLANDFRLSASAALSHTDYSRLANCAPAKLLFLALVFILLFATKIGFINLPDRSRV